MVFESIFGKEPEEETEEQFIEIDMSREEKKKVNIRIENLENYRDVDLVQRLLREGNIVFLKIRSLREKNLGELKRAVAKLRKSSMAMGGDIVGVDDNFLVLCPPFAKVFRQAPEEVEVEG